MAQRLPDAWLEELRSRLNIVDVVSEYVQLKPKGRRYWGLCPFHNEKTPSFSVDPTQQMYYCFGCHKGGNIIGFVMELERMEFMDAVTMLAERARLSLPEGGASAPRVDNALKERVYEANLAAARRFHELLWTPEGASALAYLHKRGLDDGDIRRFGLGATGPGWTAMTDYLTEKGFETEVLVASGLSVRKETRVFDMFRERVMFPIINAQNRVLGFGGRAMGEGNPKYLNTSDTLVFNKRMGLYAMNFVRKERGLKKLILVEGYMDVVSLRRAGIAGVVATLGTALTEEQARLIKRYAPEVWVGYDGDAAGQKAIDRALEIFEAQDIFARVLVFPGGMDPDDFVRKEGAAGFERLAPMEPVAYRMKRAAEGLELSTQEGRRDYALKCCEILKKVDSPVELELYVNRLSIETGVSQEALMAQVGVTARREPEKRFSPRQKRLPEETEARKAQRMLLMLLGAKLIPPGAVKAQDFDDPLYRSMAEMLLEGVSASALLDRLPEESRDEAARALTDEVPPGEEKALAMAEDCLAQIRKNRAEAEIARLQEEIKGAPQEKKIELMRRIAELTKEK